MRLTRLHLRNYRVFEGPLDLDLPPGLVGVYGPNGAGKSTIVESIRWTLFGRSRTANDEIRTAGIRDDCVSEVEFEHEGHLYLVRRTITGATATVRARAHADGQQVSEGVRDTARYVQSVLGMDDSAFRASVFAEQKQLAAFSDQTPTERRRLVLQLLGITPLDAARDLARKDARTAQTDFERLRAVLGDLDRVRAEAAAAAAAAVAAEHRATVAEASAGTARAELEAAAARAVRLDVLRQEHDGLVAEGRAVRAERDRAVAAADKLAAEVGALDRAAADLAALLPDAEGWLEADARLRVVEAVVAADLTVRSLPRPAEPPVPDEDGCEAARAAAEEARADVAVVGARLEGARAGRDGARVAMDRSTELTGEAGCPLCGQPLGDAFEAVRSHRAADLAAAERLVTDLELDRRRAGSAATAAADRAAVLARGLRDARQARTDYDQVRARRADAEAARARAEARLGRPVRDGEQAALAAEVDRRRRAADDCRTLQGRLQRRAAAAAELDVERAAAAESQGRLDALADKEASLGFRPEELFAARAARDRLAGVAEDATAAALAATVAAGRARAGAESEDRRLAEAADQHARLATLTEDSRHLARLAELLNAFRNSLVATVGPRLSTQAAELFAELTDHEYDELSVDPDTYEIRVRDDGLLYGMSRFSGSETDLANLALRVAVSEHVRFQAGGAVGLLVLDEVFGPLDDERKERMLLALQRLRARFRQVLVVTHDAAIKEQLPSAIEVVKLPGRRATARLLSA